MSLEPQQSTKGSPNMEKKSKTDALMAWSNLALAILAGISAVFAWLALQTSEQTQRELKKMDLLSDYQRRYEGIIYDVKERTGETDRAAGTNYYHRFWD